MYPKPNFDYLKEHFYDEITNYKQWNAQYKAIIKALNVSKFENKKYKIMEEYFGDIAMAYLIYKHDKEGYKFSGL